MAVIRFPSDADGKYVIYTFDSFQAEMPSDIQWIFALLLMEYSLCDEDVTSAPYECDAVKQFMTARMKMIRVKVGHVFGQRRRLQVLICVF